MNQRISNNTLKFSALIFWVVVSYVAILVYGAHVDAMSSTHYQIKSDTINFGGSQSGSATYSENDTIGEVATGVSSSTNYLMKAGFQQMQSVTISVVPPSNIVMPPIGGVTGGTADGATSFTVTTDDTAGYTATIQASSSPALQSASSTIPDYVPSGSNPDFTFVYAATSSAFGFSPEGVDIDQRFKDNGSVCNAGSSDTAYACWDGLSTTPKTIVTRTSDNQPGGSVTTLRFRAASGNNHIQIDGLYTATTTVTIMPL